MDAITFVSHHISRLQDLLSEVDITDNPTFVEQVVTAIKDLHFLELQLPGRQTKDPSVVKVLYSVEDITDSLIIRKEHQLTRKGENDDSKKKVHRLFTCFKSSRSQNEFALELEKFRTEITALSAREDFFGSSNHTTWSFQNEEGQQSRQQPHVVGFQQQIKDLVARLMPETNCNTDLSGTHDQSSEVIEEITTEQDGNQSSKVIAEISSVETTNNHSDNKPSDLASRDNQLSKKILMICQLSKFLRRLRSRTENTLLQSSINSSVDEQIEEKVSERESDHSTNQVKVIAVVGEAGSGKSTLARTVYYKIAVGRHFTSRAWVRVSCESKDRDVLLSILKQTKEDVSDSDKLLETSSEEELRSHIKKRLKDNNYLIVIEDVQTPEVWKAVRTALNDSSCHRGKIIVTSRDPKATSGADSTLPVLPLSNDESWKLFLNKVQLAEDSEVMSTSKEKLLKICGGLPLLIVWLADLLSNKGPADWSSEMRATENSEHILGLLNYQDLPSQVKPCFVYMGLFQKGHDIPVRRLIHLWCAEGLLTPSTIKQMVPKDLAEKVAPEDLAELFLLMLVNRNMIQVTGWTLDGSPKTCRMRDHLHDIFSQKAEDVGLFYHDQFQNSHAAVKQPHFPVRRLAAAYLGNNNFPSSSLDFGHLHSCVVFDMRRVRDTPASDIRGFLKKVIDKRDFGLLKVLDLEGVYKPELDNAEVEKLLQLRYLGLRSTCIDSLPSFVGFLPHLETLDLKRTKIPKLPPSIWKAKKLQHLYLGWNHSEIVLNSSFSNSLSNLRTLWGLCIKDDCNGKLNFQRSFSRLRKLGLKCHSTSAFKIITQLTQLQSLKVKYVEEDDRRSNSTPQQWPQLVEAAELVRRRSTEKTSGPHLQLNNMEKLQNFHLTGKLEKQVINNCLPPNVRILTLFESRLEDDPMPVLEKLPHLKILRLFDDSYVGEKIKCSLDGFPELDVLKLRKLPELKEWIVEEGAMCSLRKLEIMECNQLQVPRELQHLLPTECN